MFVGGHAIAGCSYTDYGALRRRVKRMRNGWWRDRVWWRAVQTERRGAGGVHVEVSVAVIACGALSVLAGEQGGESGRSTVGVRERKCAYATMC